MLLLDRSERQSTGSPATMPHPRLGLKAKAMLRPSGDQAGESLDPSKSAVMERWTVPSRLSRNRSEKKAWQKGQDLCNSSETYAMKLPPGDHFASLNTPQVCPSRRELKPSPGVQM